MVDAPAGWAAGAHADSECDSVGERVLLGEGEELLDELGEREMLREMTPGVAELLRLRLGVMVPEAETQME